MEWFVEVVGMARVGLFGLEYRESLSTGRLVHPWTRNAFLVVGLHLFPKKKTRFLRRKITFLSLK